MKAIGSPNLSKRKEFLGTKKLDAAIFLNSDPIFDTNIKYFSNFEQEPGGYGCLLLITEKERKLLISSLDFARAEDQADVEEVVDVKKFNHSYTETIKKILPPNPRLGIINSIFPASLYEALKEKGKARFLDISDFMSSMRSVKFENEIKLLKEAAKIGNSAIRIIEEVVQEISKGRKVREMELAKKIEQELIERGSKKIGFETIVSSGERTAFPHPYPSASNNFISKGIGYADFGAVYEGYFSDVTVPFTIGRLDENEKKIVEACIACSDLAIKNIRPGISISSFAGENEKYAKSWGFEYIHALGHGLGLELHDEPIISQRTRGDANPKFKNGMVFTIEPGIYVKGVGGCRIENDFLLKNKVIPLTNSILIES